MKTEYHKEFSKVLRQLSNRHHTWQVFSDFCEMAALSYSNVMGYSQAREDRYLSVIGKYNQKEVDKFPILNGLVVLALEEQFQDFLGQVFMELELGSHWQGQFFTPYDLCKMMAQMNMNGIEDAVQDRGFVTLSEPACGAGAMVIATAEAMREKGINYQNTLHVTAIDVSNTAAYMAYIQLFLLHVPAVVVVGNTLTMETREIYCTTAHYMGFWESRLQKAREAGQIEVEQVGDTITTVIEPAGQVAFNF